MSLNQEILITNNAKMSTLLLLLEEVTAYIMFCSL